MGGGFGSSDYNPGPTVDMTSSHQPSKPSYNPPRYILDTYTQYSSHLRGGSSDIACVHVVGVGMDYLFSFLLSFASVLCTCTFMYAVYVCGKGRNGIQPLRC